MRLSEIEWPTDEQIAESEHQNAIYLRDEQIAKLARWRAHKTAELLEQINQMLQAMLHRRVTGV